MSHYRVRLTLEAVEDLKRLQAFLIDKDPTVAARAVDLIETAFGLLEYSPFSCRKAWAGDRPLLRELLIPFGNAGYVALFGIDDPAAGWFEAGVPRQIQAQSFEDGGTDRSSSRLAGSFAGRTPTASSSSM